MRKLYDKKNISAYFQNDKVAVAKKKLQEKESEMEMSTISDD
jgi:hypothetical protein